MKADFRSCFRAEELIIYLIVRVWAYWVSIDKLICFQGCSGWRRQSRSLPLSWDRGSPRNKTPPLFSKALIVQQINRGDAETIVKLKSSSIVVSHQCKLSYLLHFLTVSIEIFRDILLLSVTRLPLKWSLGLFLCFSWIVPKYFFGKKPLK